MQTKEQAVASEIRTFWFNELTPQDWYEARDALDETCRERFGQPWQDLQAGHLEIWRSGPDSMMSYILLADQLPRNMYRNTANAFASDVRARSAAKQAIDASWDMRFGERDRQFFYMPLMHSECIEDQERCVRLVCTRMPEAGAATLLHARAHREIIRRHGRFPTRNAALGRSSSAAELTYLNEGGYGAVVRSIQKT